MGRLIDADKLHYIKGIIHFNEITVVRAKEINHAPTVEAIPKDQINKAIEKIEQYICDVETDTVKAQGMAQALDMFEQMLGGVEDGNDDSR